MYDDLSCFNKDFLKKVRRNMDLFFDDFEELALELDNLGIKGLLRTENDIPVFYVKEVSLIMEKICRALLFSFEIKEIGKFEAENEWQLALYDRIVGKSG